MDGACQLDGIAMTLDVHVERHGLRAQQMIVHRRNLDAALGKLAHDRRDLVLGQHEIAHHHGLLAHRLERDPSTQCKARPDADAVDRYLEISSWEAYALDASALHGAGLAER